MIVALDRPVRSLGLVGLDFGVTAAVAVAVGTFVGTAFPREMEGTIILFLLAGLQAVTNPFGLVAKVLPFWSSRELGTVAVDGADEASLLAGLLHALGVVEVCAVGTALASGRLRARPG
ncbi:hypothetical protein [Euzebya sp.]|uniref:hypothetical protein n=1 Tax=Euzebya sp. TaxID=1971409 RepID=UPI0035143F46